MIKLELPPLYRVDSDTHNGFQKLSYELMDGFAQAFYYHSYTTGSFEGEATVCTDKNAGRINITQVQITKMSRHLEIFHICLEVCIRLLETGV